MTKKKDPKDYLPDGRPTKYRKVFDELAYRFTLLGATDKELASLFGVAKSTINKWKLAHPGFSDSITRGKFVADSNVAERLYQRAMGYEHDEEKIFQYEGQPVRVKTKKHYPPDTQAASLWLRNRQPDKWRDRTELTVRKPEEEMVPTKDLIRRNKELQDELKLLEDQL
jgi:hypothetical protein